MPEEQTLAHPVEIATDIAVAIEDARNAVQSATRARNKLGISGAARQIAVAVTDLESAILRLQAAQRGGNV